jgi:methylmalonyl-CoA/ethylmalonyl-CoA epimerase
MKPAPLRPDQIGILVDDLENAARRFGGFYAVQEWRVWTYGPHIVPRMTYRGRPASYEMRLALGGADPQIELIEPLDGASIYRDWIDQRGYGLHHLGAFVENVEAGTRAMQAAGFDLIQSGSGYGLGGDGGYAYFDTIEALGFVAELIEIPAERREPEQVWPADGWRSP